MKLVIFSSSQRKSSQSAKVGEFIRLNLGKFSQSKHIELQEIDLPFWDGSSNKGQHWEALNQSLNEADAIVLITPEWNGVASPLLKNFLMMCDGAITANKPVLLVSVSSGVSGVYPIAELKMNAFKNNKMLPIPDHIIVRSANEVLLAECESERDQQLRKRIDYSLHMLFMYAEALKSMRLKLQDQPYPNQGNFSFGM
ncbi:NADPH-dependent oxidoreductase [Parashewanella spongiae]|uniref:NADPH-dependent oxidoreductase n=1 Tax=Parashewanella spongiae TaxID=342950 RepID=A0A3A6UGH5_9GAMM|nr:NAD(P)H-dependent oxidoreductase [Parashewanella spongiae]MCL1077814.1 NAD(P)H-dependent oxidoreductase [Parashewanella spongiae]RJY18010.1 NADPH-dependent oxidoreductase [Parashewanella spongiae]